MDNKSAVILVSVMERSVAFYTKYLGLAVEADTGAKVTLTGGVVLQAMETRFGFICGLDAGLRGNGADLYFEKYDFDGFVQTLDDVDLVHPPMEHPWGQRLIRLYDPDGYIIEVGEDITAVVQRFVEKGKTIPEIAARMDVDQERVLRWLQAIDHD